MEARQRRPNTSSVEPDTNESGKERERRSREPEEVGDES